MQNTGLWSENSTLNFQQLRCSGEGTNEEQNISAICLIAKGVENFNQ
jgi:hypothetical protein